MKKVVIAFDVDGTLRCNCTPTCQDVNRRILDLFYILKSMKNTQIVIWSGGGAQYARNFMAKFPSITTGVKFASKGYIGVQDEKHLFDPPIRPDIAIDDIQECELGLINLIVKEK